MWVREYNSRTDAARLRSLKVYRRNPWSRRIQQLVRGDVDYTVKDKTRRARAHVWDDPAAGLLGIAVWEPADGDATAGVLALVAVHVDHGKCGIGSALVATCIDEMSAAGLRRVTGRYHRRNRPIMRLLAPLGAGTKKDPEDGEFVLFTANLP